MKYPILLAALLVSGCGSPTAPATLSSTPPAGNAVTACEPVQATDTRHVIGTLGLSVGAHGQLVPMTASSDEDPAPAAGPWTMELDSAPAGVTVTVAVYRLPKPARMMTEAETNTPPWPVAFQTTVTTPLPRVSGRVAPILCWTGAPGDSYALSVKTEKTGGVRVGLLIRQPR